MEINKKELYDYIIETINDNLQYDNLVESVNIFGNNELEITTNKGEHFTIKIEIE